jgi:arylsulfatase A-like enzyme
MMRPWIAVWLGVVVAVLLSGRAITQQPQPNIILIYTDDIGYGDVGCYGAQAVATPNVDRLARQGRRFTDAYCTSATCTPSRYSLLSGEYAFRRQGTGVLRGNAALILDTQRASLPGLLQRAGYRTAVVGKWHLGLGSKGAPLDWNGKIAPGPLEVGFDECLLLPATGDRVPCVYVDGHGVVGADPSDPIEVSYAKRIGDAPTGKERPDLLKMMWDHGHNATIVNGISRIGFMTGGQAARWVDEDMADVFVSRALRFLEENKERRFFLYFSTHDIHVPRTPHGRFVGKTDMGPRGDAIVQMDWCVGELLDKLDALGLTDDTLVIFTSDNGPVVNDGYVDESVDRLGDHDPNGGLRGGKYSAFEAGTRVPFVVRWPGRVEPGVSAALVSQVDACATFAALCDVDLADEEAPDSLDASPAWFGADAVGRDHVVLHAQTLAVRQGDLKYIRPRKGARISKAVNIELGNDEAPQLYDLRRDMGERRNLAKERPDDTGRLARLLRELEQQGRTRPARR